METAATTEMSSLNTKMDRIIELLEMMVNTKKQEQPKKILSNNNEWTATNYNNQIIIKFPYNEEFKQFIKQLGGSWNVSKKGWAFPQSSKDHVINETRSKFPNWDFVNNIITENDQ